MRPNGRQSWWNAPDPSRDALRAAMAQANRAHSAKEARRQARRKRIASIRYWAKAIITLGNSHSFAVGLQAGRENY